MCRLCGEAQPRIITPRLMVSLPVHVSCLDLFIVYTNMSGVIQGPTELPGVFHNLDMVLRFLALHLHRRRWRYYLAGERILGYL